MSAEYIKKIRTESGDKQIDYTALANLPDLYNKTEIDGKIAEVQEQIVDYPTHKTDTNIHVTSEEKQVWNNKSDFSGSYNDLTNKPAIPTVPTNISAFTNDTGYLTTVPAEYVTETELNAKGYASQTSVNDLGGTVEITSDAPTKDKTVLTVNPSAEEVEIYTAAEVDEKLGSVQQTIVDQETIQQMIDDSLGVVENGTY